MQEVEGQKAALLNEGDRDKKPETSDIPARFNKEGELRRELIVESHKPSFDASREYDRTRRKSDE